MRETDLYQPVKSFLTAQGYEVKGEIHNCDVVARRGEEPPVIVELKTGFTLNLVFQAIDRLAVTDLVYLAVPETATRDWSEPMKLCRRLGLGLLLVNGRIVEARLDPLPYAPRKNTKRAGRLLREFQHRVGDGTEGGSTRRPVMTAYRQDALRCARQLAEGRTMKVRDLRQTTGVARAANILRDDVYGWFQRESRGIYALTPKGAAALQTFSDVVSQL
jgi:hypothetical protein